MDDDWLVNRKRFLDKLDIMDASFCTTDPSAKQKKIKYFIYLIQSMNHLKYFITIDLIILTMIFFLP